MSRCTGASTGRGDAVEQCVDRVVGARIDPADDDLDDNGENKNVEGEHHQFTDSGQQQVNKRHAHATQHYDYCQ